MNFIPTLKKTREPSLSAFLFVAYINIASATFEHLQQFKHASFFAFFCFATDWSNTGLFFWTEKYQEGLKTFSQNCAHGVSIMHC